MCTAAGLIESCLLNSYPNKSFYLLVSLFIFISYCQVNLASQHSFRTRTFFLSKNSATRETVFRALFVVPFLIVFRKHGCDDSVASGRKEWVGERRNKVEDGVRQDCEPERSFRSEGDKSKGTNWWISPKNSLRAVRNVLIVSLGNQPQTVRRISFV